MGQRATSSAATTVTTGWFVALLLTYVLLMPLPSRAQGKEPQLPRFASLKSDRVNMRAGPSTDTPIQWVYRRAGLPVEILREGADGWRQVRDAEGATGWVIQTVLSNRRTALVLPWELKPGAPPPLAEVRADNSATAEIVAKVEAGVIANIVSCASGWCRISAGDARGWIEQKKLWGVYQGEVVR